MLLIVLTGAIAGSIIFKALVHFGRKNIIIFPLIPLRLFCFGYILRLTDYQSIIDIGYFFTDISFLLIYVTFATGVILGQLKYWKK